MALVTCPCAFRLHRLAQSALPGLGVRFPPMCSCVLPLSSHICALICAFIYVLSYVCFHMCALICLLLLCSHMSAPFVLSYMFSPMCAPIYVCSHLCALLCALICEPIVLSYFVCVHLCALICVLAYVCSHMSAPLVLSYMCSLMCAPIYVCSHLCAFICVLSSVSFPMCCHLCALMMLGYVLFPIPPATLFGVLAGIISNYPVGWRVPHDLGLYLPLQCFTGVYQVSAKICTCPQKNGPAPNHSGRWEPKSSPTQAPHIPLPPNP